MKATKLVPAEPVEEIDANKDMLVGQDESNSLLGLSALPVERLVPTTVALLGAPKKPGCMLCEYVLHEIVNDLRNVTVKEEIEAVRFKSFQTFHPLLIYFFILGGEEHLQEIAQQHQY